MFFLMMDRKGPKHVVVECFEYIIMNLWQLMHLLDNIKNLELQCTLLQTWN
jgi:hypothetical protein